MLKNANDLKQFGFSRVQAQQQKQIDSYLTLEKSFKDHVTEMQRRSRVDTQKRRFASDVRAVKNPDEPRIDQIDFFKNSFWGVPLPMSKINRVLESKGRVKPVRSGTMVLSTRASTLRPLSPSPETIARRNSLIKHSLVASPRETMTQAKRLLEIRTRPSI